MHTFKSLLATTDLGRMSHWHKEAQSMDQAPDTQFESDFSKLAFMFLQDRAAPLLPYLLGFETVERSEDGSRAIGIFGFKLGKDYYYIPAFFLNNQIKGMDILFKKSTNTFMPLTEDWLNYILNRQTVELGDAPADPGKLQGDFDVPNFDFLQHPRVGPLGYHDKHAEADLFPGSTDGEWSLSTAWQAICKTAEDGVKFDEKFAEMWDGFVGAYQHKPAEKAASSELISDYLKKVGGPRAAMSLLKSFGLKPKMASAVLKFYKDLDVLRVADYDKDCYQIKKAREAKPTYFIELGKTAEDDITARELLEQGFVIKDHRPKDQKSEVYSTDFAKSFTNPDRPGKYKILTDDNEFRDGYIFRSPISDSYVIYWPEEKAVTGIKNLTDVIVMDGLQGECSEVFDKASKPTSMDAGGNSREEWHSQDKTYLILGPEGQTAGKFRCWHVISEPDKRIRLEGSGNVGIDLWDAHSDNGDFSNYWRHDNWHYQDGTLRRDPAKMDCCEDSCSCCDYYHDIELADFSGDVSVRKGVLTLPSNWKVIEINDKGPAFQIGTNLSITDNLIKNAFHKLRIHADNGNYHLSMDEGYPGKPLSLKQASLKLVTSLGIDAREVAQLLKKANQEQELTCFVKMGQFVGVSMPQPPSQAGGVDPYTGMPLYDMPYVTETTGQMTGVPTLPDPTQPGYNLGGDISRQSGGFNPGDTGVPELDEESMQLAQQAGQIGQKQVFDHAAIGGLAKVYDVSAVINSYLPEFLQTIDRLGRLIFLYYWKHEDFTNRYGTGDTVELEDSLRGVFKQLGDLTLMLKQKSIGPEDADTVTV